MQQLRQGLVSHMVPYNNSKQLRLTGCQTYLWLPAFGPEEVLANAAQKRCTTVMDSHWLDRMHEALGVLVGNRQSGLSVQASLAEAEQETLEDAMTTNQERHYMNTAAECKVSSQTLQAFLDDIELSTHTEKGAETPDKTAGDILPSSSVHRLGLGISDLTLLAC